MVEHVRGTLKIQLRDGTMVDFASPFRRVNVLDELEKKTKRQLPNLDSKGQSH
jgi:lysyl-tRNA synthetase class II